MSTPPRATRVASTDARRRIVEAAVRLLADRPFAALTVDGLMAEAQLNRTAFYRHFTDLPQLALALLPDDGDPLVDQVARGATEPRDVVEQMVDGLVALYHRHGPLLRAIDDAARADPAVAAQIETALVAPRRLIAGLLRDAPNPPPDPRESARVLMAASNGYLLEAFGTTPQRTTRPKARAALLTLWERVLS